MYSEFDECSCVYILILELSKGRELANRAFCLATQWVQSCMHSQTYCIYTYKCPGVSCVIIIGLHLAF